LQKEEIGLKILAVTEFRPFDERNVGSSGIFSCSAEQYWKSRLLLKMEIVYSSETLGYIRHITECHKRQELCHKNYPIPRL
jgi:hypothetical protein